MNARVGHSRRFVRLGLVSLALASCTERVERVSQRNAEVGASSAVTRGTVRPKVRHENWDGSQDESGARLIKPESFDRVLRNTFGLELELVIDGEDTNPLQDEYALLLGGVDYAGVTVRTTHVTSVMPLVMNRIAEGYCGQLIRGDVFDLAGTDDENIQELYERLRSRPIADEALHAARALLSDADELAPRARWKSVCIFFFLTDGSMLVL